MFFSNAILCNKQNIKSLGNLLKLTFYSLDLSKLNPLKVNLNTKLVDHTSPKLYLNFIKRERDS